MILIPLKIIYFHVQVFPNVELPYRQYCNLDGVLVRIFRHYHIFTFTIKHINLKIINLLLITTRNLLVEGNLLILTPL